jgi:hypothetical protein
MPKGSPGHSTDFSQYSLAQLTHMLYESDPATGLNTAQAWDATGKMLHEQASNLESRLRNFDGEWRGTASDEYKRMVVDLIGGIRKVADTSLQMRDLTYDAVDSLNKARASMPPPVDIPTVSPATLALATQPLPIDASTPAPVAAQMASEQAKAVAAITAQQDAMASASAAHAQAVTVMKTLASSYVVAQNRFPPAPDAAPATPAGPAPVGGSAGSAIPGPPPAGGIVLTAPGTTKLFPGQTQTGGTGQTADNPLFGDMFTVGMAAAAAAAAGKFVGSATATAPRGLTPLRPVSNGLSLTSADPNAGKKPDDKNKADQHAAVDAAGVLGSRFLANKLGKMGGGGPVGGGPGGPDGAGIDPAAAKAAADAAKNLAVAETSAVNDFAGGAMGTAAAAAAGRGGMMPMMPMSGMAGAGMGDGSNRRIPPWLVETEDVWGASSPVSPGLIGGDL